MRARKAALLVLVLLLVPVGTLGILLVRIRASGAYRAALEKALADPKVAEALGPPVAADWYALGTVGEGRADLSIPLRGPARSGKLLVRASRAGGGWVLEDLVLVTMDGPNVPRTLALLPVESRPTQEDPRP